MNIYVYDIEVMINYFAVIFKDVNTQQLFEFIVYKTRNDISDLYQFLCYRRNDWLVGYNSFNYDDQILTFIYNNYERLFVNEFAENITATLYALSNDIINNETRQREYAIPFQSVDLMKVGNLLHKSLKLVAVNLKWHKIQDLPLHHNVLVEDKDLSLLHEYNLNDVLITEQLYIKLKDALILRWEISQKYKINVISESKSGVANRLLERLYSDKTGIPIKELKQMRTHRPIIHFENVVLPEITFETPELKSILFKILRSVYYKDQPFIKRNIPFNGVIYKMGFGGLHSDDKPGSFEANETEDIIDCDISSMYPTLIINYNFVPAHLGSSFTTLYKEIRDRRLTAKHAGQMNESDTLKITINSVFGKTGNENHWLYDPLVTLRTTINGQLFMLMLIERLTLQGFQVISANTDGIITIVPKDKRDLYNDICQKWCEETMFELEFTEYKKYIRKDVNNYIAITKSGKIKTKGEFVQSLDLEKGVDKPIVSTALYEYFVNGIKPEVTVQNSKDILDFCTAKKIDSKFENYLYYIEDFELKRNKLQDTVRFYVSKRGDQLYKVDKKFGEKINYCVGYNVKILNDLNKSTSFDEYDVNLSYYIAECYKVINQIEDKQLKLF
jgi:CRISPR/Cas system CMR-associated protein Cmr5 small subunit